MDKNKLYEFEKSLRDAHDKVHAYDLKMDHALDKFIKEKLKGEVLENTVNKDGGDISIKEQLNPVKFDNNLNENENENNIKSDNASNNKPSIPNLDLNNNLNSIKNNTNQVSANDSAKDSAKKVTISKENITPFISSSNNNDNKHTSPNVANIKEKEDPFEDSLNNNYDDPFASDTKTKDDQDVFNY